MQQERNDLLAYVGRLEEERDKWEGILKKVEQSSERAQSNVMRSLERKTVASGAVPENGPVDTGPRPRHVLRNVMRRFEKHVADRSKQEEKAKDNLLARRAALEDSIAKVKAEVASLEKLLNAEPREELLRLEKYWTNVKEVEEKRQEFLQKRVAMLEMREALRKE
ncbi:hypothetical protein Aduo_017651 [Ancylostoma duodenale]